jgi:DNA-binding response OmpR family regulator
MAGTILVVDDDEQFLDSIRAVLTTPEVSVETALTAAEACEKLDRGSFCGLVLDVVLTDGSGFDVLRHMERTGKVIPTVVVTQKLPLYVREMLDEDLVKMVFPKPIEPRLLAAVVFGLCGIES